MTRRRRGGIKSGKSIYPVKNSLSPLYSLEPSERFTELHRGEKREEGDRGEQGKKGGNQKERDRSRQCSPQPRTPTDIHRVGLRREVGGRR